MTVLRDLTLLFAGLGLAVFGVASALQAPALPGPQEAPATASPADREVVEVPMGPVVAVEGLPPSVSRVLADSGYAGIVSESALTETLPPSVVRVLIDHGVTLTVAEGSG